MENDLYGHHLNPSSRYSIYAPSRSLLTEPYVPPSSLLASSSSRYLSSSLADRYLPSEAVSAASRPYSFLDASRPYSVPAAVDLVGTKRLSEAFYEQSVIGNHTINGQSEDWLSTNLLAKRPRTEPTRNLPVYPQRPGEKDCAHYMLTRTCKFGDACKFDHPIWVPEGGIPDWKEAQPDLSLSHPERPGEPDCPYFMKTGICKFGFNCKFNHPKDKLVTSISSDNVDASALPERPSEPPCAYYVKTGKCKFGASCKFHHPKDVHVSPAEPETGNSEQHMHKTETTAGGGKLNQPSTVAPVFRYTSKGLPIRLGEEDCPFYMKTGSCKFGGTCRFSHPDINPINLAAMGHSVFRSPANLGLVDPVASILQGHGPRLAQTALGPGPVIYPQRPEAIECDHYMKTGECKFGEKCKFHHPIDRYNPNSSANCVRLTLAGLPRREGSVLCAFYMKTGTCKYGPQCRFDHPPPGEVMAMAAPQDTSTAANSAEKEDEKNEKNAETAQGAKE